LNQILRILKNTWRVANPGQATHKHIMDILHVVHGYYPALGGSERLIQRVSEDLHSGYADRVTIFTADGYNNELFVDPSQPRLPATISELNGVTIRRFAVFNRLGKPLYHLQRLAYLLHLPGNQHLRTLYNGPIMPGLRQAIEAIDCDIVAAAAFPLLHMFITLKACRRSQKRLVFIGALHPMNVYNYQRPMIYQAISQANAYIALSSYERDYLIQEWGIRPKKITVIGAGVDAERYVQANTTKFRQENGLEDYPLVAFIGQQGQNKGVDTLILAMKQVWRSLPEVRLLIAGSKTHFTQKLEQLIKTTLSPVEQDRIIFKHNFAEEEKPLLFAACDIFAYPSRYESFGIAFVEAWAAGKPVIGCRVGAVPAIIDEDKDGLLVTVDDSQALAQALLRLLNDSKLRKQMGQAGREKVLRQYTWGFVTARWRQVYEQVLNE